MLQSLCYQQEGSLGCIPNNGEGQTGGNTTAMSSMPALITTTRQLQSLHLCTGVEYFGMVTCSSVDDMIQPSWLGSKGATIFFADTLEMNAWDLLRQFEQSCCSKKFCKLITTKI
jgi:hypothetical protein